ncbi:MAG: PilN domain-containing protein [Pyrinomonadaceae bacterium]
MIKINLLESVTDRQGGAVVAVERRAASPMTRLLLMSLAVLALAIAVIAFDIINTSMQKDEATKALEEQKQIAVQYDAMLKELNDLDAKIKNIDTRVTAIKQLRSTQAGPSAVLEALKERILANPGLYLDSVEQKGEQLTINGNSPDESVVTKFGRDLEFSDGLFSNLNIETQRKDNPYVQASSDPNAPRPEIVNFTIHCAYTPSKASGANNMNGATPANAPAGAPPVSNAPTASSVQPAAPNSGNANPPQVARKE